MIPHKTILFACSLLLLLACGQQEDISNKKIFRYNQITPISSLDPAFARTQANLWAIDHLYNGLVQLDDSMNIVPSIAKSWTISPDGLTYTFNLRNDVFFHNDVCFEKEKGRKLVAEDIKYSFERILDDNVASPGSWVFKGKVDSLNPFTVPNDSTFELHLKSPFRPMLSILTMQYCFIVPKEAVTKYAKDFRSHPVGTGPFKLKRWLESQGLFLQKNDNYFEYDNGQRMPFVDGVRVSFMGDRKTAYLEMMKGRLDFMSGVESSIVNELLTPEGDLQPKVQTKIQLLNAPYLNTEYLGINLGEKGEKAFKDKRVRQALNYGFDRTQMLLTFRNSNGRAADAGFAAFGLPSHDATINKGYQYNPSKARQLLADAGYPAGKGFPVIKLYTNKDYLDICTFITRQWEDLGIKVKVELLESATLREMMSKGEATFFRGSWIADYPDAESFYTVFYSKNGAPPNYTQFKNTTFDRVYEASLSENDDAKRYDMYHQLDNILLDEAPVVFLFYDESSRFASKRVRDLGNNAINLLSLKRVKLD